MLYLMLYFGSENCVPTKNNISGTQAQEIKLSSKVKCCTELDRTRSNVELRNAFQILLLHKE
jgi:hypothetical protein